MSIHVHFKVEIQGHPPLASHGMSLTSYPGCCGPKTHRKKITAGSATTRFAVPWNVVGSGCVAMKKTSVECKSTTICYLRPCYSRATYIEMMFGDILEITLVELRWQGKTNMIWLFSSCWCTIPIFHWESPVDQFRHQHYFPNIAATAKALRHSVARSSQAWLWNTIKHTLLHSGWPLMSIDDHFQLDEDHILRVSAAFRPVSPSLENGSWTWPFW